MGQVIFESIWGRPVPIDPMTALLTVEPLPAPYRYMGREPAAQISIAGVASAWVKGDPAMVRAQLAAGADSLGLAISYTPTLASVGGGAGTVLAMQGVASAIRLVDEVTIQFSFLFTPNAAGTPEVISWTLPVLATFPAFTPDPNPFGAVGNAGGVITVGAAAADFVTRQVQARAGSLLIDAEIDQTTATAVLYGVVCRYRAA